MRYTIHTQNRERHLDHIQDDGRRRGPVGDRQLTYDTEEDGHPVVIMESGVDSFDQDGCEYHEKARVCREPAKTWEEAKEIAERVWRQEGYQLADSPLHGSKEPGDPDYWAVEVLKRIEEPA